MNKIVILGCGYIGTNVANYIARNSDDKVYVLGIKNEYVDYLDHKVNFIEKNIENINEKDITLFKDAVIIDAVGNTNATTGIKSSNTVFLQNCINKVEVVRKLCDLEIRKYVFLSSGGTVYEDSKTEHREDEKLDPQNIYALEKIIIEKYLKILSVENDKFNYLILRISNPYGGIVSKNKKQGIIDVAINRLINDEELEFYGDIENIRDYIYIDNVAEYIWKIAISKEKNEVFNIGSGIGVSIQRIFQIIEEIFDKKLNLKITKTETVNIKSNILNVDRITKFVKLTHNYDIKQGILKCVDSKK